MICFSTDHIIILLNLKSPLAVTSRVRLDQCFPNSHDSCMTLKTAIRSSLKVCFQTSMCSKLGPQLTVLLEYLLKSRCGLVGGRKSMPWKIHLILRPCGSLFLLQLLGCCTVNSLHYYKNDVMTPCLTSGPRQ